MSKYFIIARKEDNSYTIIDINGGNRLEDIDIYTSRYNNKNELLKELENNGLDISSGIDLFIANYSTRSHMVKTRPILYNRYYNKLLNINARKSLRGEDLYTKNIYDKALELTKSGYYLYLIKRGYFDLYKDFKDMIVNGKLSFAGNKRWIRNSYSNYRDTMASILLYYGLNIDKDTNIEDVIERKQRLRNERKEIYPSLENALKSDVVGQMSLFNNSNSFIHITHAAIDNISRLPKITVMKNLDRLSIKDDKQVAIKDLVKDPATNSLDKSLLKETVLNRSDREKEIIKFLTDADYFKDNHIVLSGKRYSLDYSNLPFKLDAKDENTLNKLIPSRLLGLVKEYARYRELINSRMASSSSTIDIYQDKASCYNEMTKVLKSYSDSTFMKTNNFVILYKDCYDKTNNKSK